MLRPASNMSEPDAMRTQERSWPRNGKPLFLSEEITVTTLQGTPHGATLERCVFKRAFAFQRAGFAFAVPNSTLGFTAAPPMPSHTLRRQNPLAVPCGNEAFLCS